MCGMTAVHSFTLCVHTINEWMKASRLWLNASKTQIMWLGSTHQLKQIIDISDIPVLSTTVKVVDTVLDLGVTIDSQLSLSCRADLSGWILPASPAMTSHLLTLNRNYEDTDPGINILPFRVMQFSATRSARHSSTYAAVSTKQLGATHQWRANTRPYQASVTPAVLASSLTSHRVQGHVPSWPVVVRTRTWLPG